MKFHKTAILGSLMVLALTSAMSASERPAKPEKMQLLIEEQLAGKTREELHAYSDSITKNIDDWIAYSQDARLLDRDSQEYPTALLQHIRLLIKMMHEQDSSLEKQYEKNYIRRPLLKKIADLSTLPLLPVIFMHEGAHALMGWLLNGDPIKLHLGAPVTEVPAARLAIAKTPIHFHSYNFDEGFSIVSSCSPKKEFLMTAAGPLAGLATSLFIAAKAFGYAKHTSNQKLRFLYCVIVCLYGTCGSSQIQQLTPFVDANGDGQKLWKFLGLPERFLSKARENTVVGSLINGALLGLYLVKRLLPDIVNTIPVQHQASALARIQR